ncbi:MAG: D-alanyl-D-alanine carboxypeptidase [Clostridia bacterium]|nr:D-alanyl-D-alanine carboxypeptidase [Clostridia bacterium]
MKKRVVSFVLVLIFVIFTMSTIASSIEIKETNLNLNVKSAVLVDAETGTVLYKQNENERLAPASVTKIMTLLLVFEAIDKGALNYEDVLTVSENASSMGGSQVFLEPGEEMSVNDLLKSVIIASANDAALTLAEHVGGSEEGFVEMMNKKAKALGMENTNFENVTGLDDDVINHLTTAGDIAKMSCELLKYEKVNEYATIWMDTIRNGEFGLTNTNRLVRYYNGITGLKTGYTSEAGYCISASAKRGELHLIAVIMGAETSQIRNNAATKLLDFGFANYSFYTDEGKNQVIDVYGGSKNTVEVIYNDCEMLLNKGEEARIEKEIQLNDYLVAPIKKNEVVGKIIYKLDGQIIQECDIISSETVNKITFFEYLLKVLKNLF